MATMLGRVLRTGLSSLRDRAASRLAALRFNPSRFLRKAWLGWRGKAGDEFILLIGTGALLLYISENHGYPDPLPVAVLALILLHGRNIDRAES